MERFLDSARAIIAEKGSIEFTVQEVVDRSKQSLRSFYQYFDGKNALLLALFDEEMELFVERMREGTAAGDPLDRLRDTVLMLYDLCAPGRLSVQPLFADFAQRLIVDQPDDVTPAYAPVIEYIASIVRDAAAADLLRPGRPHRLATIVLQTATITAGRDERQPADQRRRGVGVLPARDRARRRPRAALMPDAGPRPLGVLLDEAVADHADDVALRMDESSWTYGELQAMVDRTATALAGHGVAVGSRVGLSAGNSAEFVATVFATARLGATVVMISTAWRDREVAHALAITRPTHLVIDGSGATDLARLVTDRPVLDIAALADPRPTLPPAGTSTLTSTLTSIWTAWP